MSQIPHRGFWNRCQRVSISLWKAYLRQPLNAFLKNEVEPENDKGRVDPASPGQAERRKKRLWLLIPFEDSSCPLEKEKILNRPLRLFDRPKRIFHSALILTIAFRYPDFFL